MELKGGREELEEGEGVMYTDKSGIRRGVFKMEREKEEQEEGVREEEEEYEDQRQRRGREMSSVNILR